MDQQKQVNYIVYTDGGAKDGSTSACACIIKFLPSGQRIKLTAVLGLVNDNEAELLGILLALSYLRTKKISYELVPQSLIWKCDRQTLVEGANNHIVSWQAQNWKTKKDQNIKSPEFWKAYLDLSQGFAIEAQHVSAHASDSNNEACDKACRWVQQRGLKLLSNHGEGLIGRVSINLPEQAWYLLDARKFVFRLREMSINNPSKAINSYRYLSDELIKVQAIKTE